MRSRFQSVAAKSLLLAVTSCTIALLAGCTVGPKYVRPSALPLQQTAPSAYQEAPPPAQGWKVSAPADTVGREDWWKVYNDATLDALEQKVTVSNQNLKADLAAYQAALQQARAVKSNLFPTITAGPQASRDRESIHHPLLPANDTNSTTYNDFILSGGFSYQVDAWGQIRREVAQAREQAQASAADLATASLSMHALLAEDYFMLRGYDTQQQLLDSTVQAYAKLLKLTQNRFRGGLATGQDVAQAQTQLETTRGQAIDIAASRAQMEHAIAVLTGQNPSQFKIAPAVLSQTPPVVPPGIPSELLERRPDVAASERRTAAANEQIGIQRAAYFPTITLSGDGGFESTALQTLIQGPSSLWGLGGSAIETLFDGGRRKALTAEARAQYDEQVALYRQSALVAFQQVEDQLAALRVLQQEQAAYAAAEQAAQRSANLSVSRYKGGVTTYLEVLQSQTALLTAQRSSADALARSYTASVLLVQALGGGWNVSKLPPD